ncbi:serine/threonine-protein kinase [Dokdonella fugitiva]|jgi:serine/threonine-protein kinase|uniref:serine/threonine-protein kinase n=1 Tax=Dokdonella fugitiva TaxID=328517 RepID=UPI0015FDB4A7|nr:serine/threonine-protein kinase [Dokdonella fugitiva]
MSTTNLRDLFESAVALAPAERASFLDAHCPDAALRARVEALLRADAADGEPVSPRRLACLAHEIGDEPAAPPAGSRIGPFEIVRVIGEGGSSTVFEAHRVFDGATQHAALKLLRQSLLSPEARRRFAREQRVLLRLQHPNIARMIEGGVTPGGLAYIALELVDGVPITEHAQARGLAARERLQLFATVCRAVDAAHRALIVHRDLKPSNVLVTADGEVKLLDFGIAKLLADETGPDATVLPAFTPAYAAPEQIDGGAITTATDVHALGIVLGELLTGERGGGAASGGSHAGARNDAATPTRPRIGGDLGAIVAKATEPDPARRYASAGELAEEIRRVLEGRPVHARPQTRRYRLRRFVARHRGAVAATCAFLAALVGALGVALWQARVAHDEAARANRQTQRAETVRDFLVSLFEAAQPDLPRERRPTVEQLVDDAGAKVLRDAALAADARADLLLTLAKVSGAIGAYEREHALLDRALPDIDRLSPSAPEARRARVLRASALVAQARQDEAIALLAPLRAPLVAEGGADAVETLLVLVDALSAANRGDDALAVVADARAVAERVGDGSDALLLHVDVAHMRILVDAQRFAQGLALADAAWARWTARPREASRDALALWSSISLAAEMTGDLARADAAYREAIALAERLYVRPHPDTAWAIGTYGSFLVAKARYDDAEPYVLRALAMRRALFGDAHPDTLNSIAALGRLRSGQLRRDEARAAFEEGVAVCRRERIRHNVCPRLFGSLSQVLAGAGDFDGARARAVEAVAMQRELTGDGSAQLVGPLGFLARAQVAQGRHAEALATTDELLAIATRNGSAASKDAIYARFQRAQALFALGRNAEALELANAVVTAQKERSPDEKSTLFAMLALQARALSRARRHDEARAAAVEALAIEPRPRLLDPALPAELERIARGG